MLSSSGLILLLASLAVFSGCETKKTPIDAKSVLKEYINQSFNVKRIQDRTLLEKYLIDDAKSRLLSWNDEQFENAFITRKREFLKLRIKEEKKISDSEDNITYELTYLDSAAQRGAKITNVKSANLIKRDGNWYIKRVQNIKELIEYENEMSLP